MKKKEMIVEVDVAENYDISNLSLVNDVLDSNSEGLVHVTTPIVGILVGFDEGGSPVVNYRIFPNEEFISLSTVELRHEDIGKRVLIVFNEGKSKEPIITGLIQEKVLKKGPEILENDSGVIIRSNNSSVEIDKDGDDFHHGEVYTAAVLQYNEN